MKSHTIVVESKFLTNKMDERPRVGVGVIITKGKKVLLLKRKNAHGDGSWAFVGGHLEFNEKLETCARREVFEEAGIRLRNLKPVTFTNDIFPKEKKHYITLYVIAEYKSGKVKIKEPKKVEALEWFKWENLPSPLFIPLKNLRRQGFNPFT